MSPRVLPVSAVLLAAVLVSSCSTKRIGISRMADAVSSTASAYARDDDPEFVRLAAPSTLKMVEMLLDGQPRHRGLLMTACSGFAQYAYGFLQVESEKRARDNPEESRDLRDRAIHMYDRARGYCLRGLDAAHPGLSAALARDPQTALAAATQADVPALYWTGIAWGGALSLSDNLLARVGELVAVRTLLGRALALDETWEDGAIHETLIVFDGMPVLLGGSASRARAHFDRAVALSNGESAFAYVTLATSVALRAKDRQEFERLLGAALAIDPSRRPRIRLANLIAQAYARALLKDADRLFR